jgi:hypothetical protein
MLTEFGWTQIAGFFDDVSEKCSEVYTGISVSDGLILKYY